MSTSTDTVPILFELRLQPKPLPPLIIVFTVTGFLLTSEWQLGLPGAEQCLSRPLRVQI